MLVVFAYTVDEIKNKNARVEELILSIAHGDLSAMGALYDCIKTDVFAYALSKLGNKSDAEDVVQDTFVQIYKYAKQYEPQHKPMAWIIRIELNLIRRRFQIASKTTSLDESYENLPFGTDFEGRLINNVFLRQLLNTLNTEEREVISLHVISGFKHREIAKILDKPLSTILSKYNRAIKKLQLVVKEIDRV